MLSPEILGVLTMINTIEKPQVAYVHVDGPFSAGISEFSGDEYPEWTVSLMSDDDEDLKVYRCATFSKAFNLGETIACDRRVEFVSDAGPS